MCVYCIYAICGYAMPVISRYLYSYLCSNLCILSYGSLYKRIRLPNPISKGGLLGGGGVKSLLKYEQSYLPNYPNNIFVEYLVIISITTKPYIKIIFL